MALPANEGTNGEVDVLRVPNFRRLWAANGFRYSAAEVAGFALPVTALVILHAEPFAMSLIFASSRLGYLLVGLPAGVWIDRWRKKIVLIRADFVYFAAFGSIPAAYYLDLLTVPHLVTVALAVSLAGVFFEIAHSSVLPEMLPKKRVSDANARLQTSETTIRTVAPSAAGALTQTVAAPLLYCFAALCHLVSALLLKRIDLAGDVAGRARKSERNFRKEVVDGLRVLIRQPLLRLLAGQAVLNNIGAGMLLTIMPVFLLTDIGLSTLVFGVLSTLGALAGLTASLVAPRLRRRIGEIRMTLVLSALAPVAVVAAPLAAEFRDVAVVLAATAEVLIGFVAVGRAVAAAGLRARVTPAEYMGRVTAANSVITQSATPLGALAGGFVATTWSTTTALWLGVLEMCVPIFLLLTSPLRRHRTLPAEWEV
ncbi:MFS transporter [Saccharothrix obliqua]|uniref:MFS transporter n=1 Tax=Saccharothrix obliqua TaxID=2861747 RepID=UPI001C5F4D07|nr:MFS transporter [Saccharothrix obliqua]MBW4717890.1 MFS transporter [Saccharothrix obliqua]